MLITEAVNGQKSPKTGPKAKTRPAKKGTKQCNGVFQGRRRSRSAGIYIYIIYMYIYIQMIIDV